VGAQKIAARRFFRFTTIVTIDETNFQNSIVTKIQIICIMQWDLMMLPGWLLTLMNSEYRLFCPGGLYFFVIWGAMLFAFRRNEELPDDSPDKRQYHPNAILIAPFTLPFILVIQAMIFVLYVILLSLLFGIFLLVFPFVLIVFRNIGLLEWLMDLFEKLGCVLLRINTFLLRMAGLPPPQPA
jgi:hypothetical protein